MKFRLVRLLGHLISLALVASLIYYIYSKWDIFVASANISWRHVVVIILCVFLGWGTNAITVMYLLRLERIQINFREILLVQLTAMLVNYLPMRIGSMLRFYYFKKIHGLEYSRMGGLTALRILFLVTITGFLGFISLAGLKIINQTEGYILSVIFAGMLCIPIMLWILPIRLRNFPENHLGRLTNNFFSGFAKIRAKPRLAILLLWLTLCQFAILSARLFFSFDAMQVQLSPWILLLLAPISFLLSFLKISPGNIGLREWIIAFLSLLAGYQFENAIFAGTLDSTVTMACTFIFGPVASWFVWLRLKNGKAEMFDMTDDKA